MVQESGKQTTGRGHCALCWTPWMCGNSKCGCHVSQGKACRFCGVGLFISTPEDERPEEELVA